MDPYTELRKGTCASARDTLVMIEGAVIGELAPLQARAIWLRVRYGEYCSP